MMWTCLFFPMPILVNFNCIWLPWASVSGAAAWANYWNWISQETTRIAALRRIA
jgi:hypothetical protein